MEPSGTLDAVPAEAEPPAPPTGDESHSKGLGPLLALVFVGGAASLGAEIAAARLLAPDFGASTVIWANTIGVVLVALSVGYWLRGRLPGPHPPQPRLRLTVLPAAGRLAARPAPARPLPPPAPPAPGA